MVRIYFVITLRVNTVHERQFVQLSLIYISLFLKVDTCANFAIALNFCIRKFYISKRNHYENTPIQIYRKFHLKNWKFSDKKLWYFFHNSAQNICCGYALQPPRRGVSNEYPHSMFLSRNKKNDVYPCKPQFYYIKVGFKGSKLYGHVFVMAAALSMINNAAENWLSKHYWRKYCQTGSLLTRLRSQVRSREVTISSIKQL